MRVPTTIRPEPTSTELERLETEIESHPIWTGLRGPVTTNGAGQLTKRWTLGYLVVHTISGLNGAALGFVTSTGIRGY